MKVCGAVLPVLVFLCLGIPAEDTVVKVVHVHYIDHNWPHTHPTLMYIHVHL